MTKASRAKSRDGLRANLDSPPSGFCDDIAAAWGKERPDLDLRMAAALLKIEHINRLHESRVQAISKTIGMKTGDLCVVLALRRIGKPFEARPTDLFRALLVTSGAITKRIARLHEDGLVLRVQSNDDGRSELVRLTAKGLAVADRAIALISSVVGRVATESGLTKEDMVLLDGCLRKLLSVPADLGMEP